MDEGIGESEMEELVLVSTTRTLNRDEVIKVWRLGGCENFVGK